VTGADGFEARRRRGQRVFYRGLDGVALDGGIWASLTPSLPDRSLFNAVIYDDPDAVVAARDRLAVLYAEAGVRAWTVWVNPGDTGLAGALEAAGHKLDGTPESMGAELAEMALDGPDLGEPGTWDDAIALNEAAYGMAAGAMASPPIASLQLLAVPGQAVVGVVEAAGDVWFGLVATHPSARGRGLCSGLMRQTLRGARDRGCTTTTLEATAKGRPVYERLGYRPLGAVQMWEHRIAEAS
jgi:GNAT superfamily N-acetyltransferase